MGIVIYGFNMGFEDLKSYCGSDESVDIVDLDGLGPDTPFVPYLGYEGEYPVMLHIANGTVASTYLGARLDPENMKARLIIHTGLKNSIIKKMANKRPV